MKTIIAGIFIGMLLVTFNATAAVKCKPDGRGGMCCWDTDRDGPFPPIIC